MSSDQSFMAPRSLLHQELWFASASTAAIEIAIIPYSAGTSHKQFLNIAGDLKSRFWNVHRHHARIHFLCFLFIIYISCFCSDITAWNFDLCSLKPSAQLTSSPHLPSSCPFSLPLRLSPSLSPPLPQALSTSHLPPHSPATPSLSLVLPLSLPPHCFCLRRTLISTSCSPPSFPKPSPSAESLAFSPLSFSLPPDSSHYTFLIPIPPSHTLPRQVTFNAARSSISEWVSFPSAFTCACNFPLSQSMYMKYVRRSEEMSSHRI